MSLYPSSTTYPSSTIYPSFASPGPTTVTVSYTVEIALGSDDFTGDYDNVTNDVTSLNIRTGKDANAAVFQAGECTLTLQRFVTPLDNPTAEGGRELYNPTSLLSPLSPQYDPTGVGPFPTQQTPGIRGLVPMRVTMTVDGTSRVLFYGWLSTWRYNRETGEARVVAKDLIWRLSRITPSFTQDPGETTASGIEKVLDEYPWTDFDLDVPIGNGTTGPGDELLTGSLEPDGISRSGLQIIDELLEAEFGTVRMEGTTFIYEARIARSLKKLPDYTIDKAALNYEPGFEIE